jgi:hypothetical protein
VQVKKAIGCLTSDETYTKERHQLLKNSPLDTREFEAAGLVLLGKAWCVTQILKWRLEMNGSFNHVRFRVPPGINWLNHSEVVDRWFSSSTQLLQLLKNGSRVVNTECKTGQLSD